MSFDQRLFGQNRAQLRARGDELSLGDGAHGKSQTRQTVVGIARHQAIGQAFGGNVVRAPAPMHGKTSRIFHAGGDILETIPSPFTATRYHSLIVDRATLPADLIATAWTEDGLIMALRHRTLAVYGVQFHPESIASEHGHTLLANFLALARGSTQPARAA